MASCDNVLKLINSKGKIVYFLGYDSAYTDNMARILSGLLELDDFEDETPEEILEKAEVDGMEFVPCENPEDIEPDEVTMFVDYGRKVASLPMMEVDEVETFLDSWDAKLVEVDGQQCIDYDGDPTPLLPWPEEFKPLLDSQEADFEALISFCHFINENGAADYLCDGKIIHSEEM